MSKRPKKRHSEDWQERKWHAEQCEQAIRDKASLSGVELLVTIAECGKTSFPHWRFRFKGCNILHYWPTRESGREGDGGKSQPVGTPDDALALALHLVGTDADAERHMRNIASD